MVCNYLQHKQFSLPHTHSLSLHLMSSQSLSVDFRSNSHWIPSSSTLALSIFLKHHPSFLAGSLAWHSQILLKFHPRGHVRFLAWNSLMLHKRHLCCPAESLTWHLLKSSHYFTVPGWQEICSGTSISLLTVVSGNKVDSSLVVTTSPLPLTATGSPAGRTVTSDWTTSPQS